MSCYDNVKPGPIFLLMNIKFQAQADEITGICRRTGLAPDALAARVAIKSETMRKIARGYQKASAQLLQALRNVELSVGESRIVRVNQEFPRRVPVVSWARAGQALDYGDLCNQIDESVETDCRDANSFALILEGDSMEPEFYAGDLVVFAPNVEPRNGDFVVCRLANNSGVLFKRLRRTGPEGSVIRLESLNVSYQPIEYPAAEVRYIYPAVDMKRRLRRG